jgi:hypothetical protein
MYPDQWLCFLLFRHSSRPLAWRSTGSLSPEFFSFLVNLWQNKRQSSLDTWRFEAVLVGLTIKIQKIKFKKLVLCCRYDFQSLFFIVNPLKYTYVINRWAWFDRNFSSTSSLCWVHSPPLAVTLLALSQYYIRLGRSSRFGTRFRPVTRSRPLARPSAGSLPPSSSISCRCYCCCCCFIQGHGTCVSVNSKYYWECPSDHLLSQQQQDTGHRTSDMCVFYYI